MWFRVLKEHEFINQRGRRVRKSPGQLVEVLNRHEADRLLADGIIGWPEYSHRPGVQYGEPAPRWTRTLRVGIWLFTSANYSGGRVLLYQYAWCLAQAGAEVWLITQRRPKWTGDYPACERLRVVIEGKDPIPPDLDLVVTDSKEAIGRRAHDWCRHHPWVAFVCWNFETPNWVAEFDPDYARRLGTSLKADHFRRADLLIACSRLSMEWALKWLGVNLPATWLPPAVNTEALSRATMAGLRLPEHPYAVWCARGAKYKGVTLAVEAVKKIGRPFDIVVIGRAGGAKETSDHRIYEYPGITDAQKFALMKSAHMVLAPSRFEGFGMVPMEALASGTPCIVYDLPVLRETYGGRLIYVPWGNEDAYKRTVQSVGEADKPNMSAHRAWAIEAYGLPAMQRRIESLAYHAVKTKVISAHLICWWGFVPESIESIYPHVDEIIVAHGPTELTQHTSDGGSLEALRGIPDPDGKIRIEARKVWKDKREMRNWCVSHARGNYMLLLDGDEIWVGLDRWIEASIDFGCPRWVNFWHGPEHWVYDSAELAGRRWGRRLDPFGSVCPHYRWSFWRRSYRFAQHPTPVDRGGNPLYTLESQQAGAERVPEAVIYHLGHALPRDVMRAKHEFYLARDGADAGRRKRMHAWHKWNGRTGDCGDGIVERVSWQLPAIVQRALERIHGSQLAEVVGV